MDDWVTQKSSALVVTISLFLSIRESTKSYYPSPCGIPLWGWGLAMSMACWEGCGEDFSSAWSCGQMRMLRALQTSDTVSKGLSYRTLGKAYVNDCTSRREGFGEPCPWELLEVGVGKGFGRFPEMGDEELQQEKWAKAIHFWSEEVVLPDWRPE